MSLPREEARSLDDVFDFLMDLSNGTEKRIPRVTRERARQVARHYPLAAGHQWLELTRRPTPKTSDRRNALANALHAERCHDGLDACTTCLAQVDALDEAGWLFIPPVEDLAWCGGHHPGPCLVPDSTGICEVAAASAQTAPSDAPDNTATEDLVSEDPPVEPGTRHHHADGRVCVRQRSGAWGIAVEVPAWGLPATGFCSRPHHEGTNQ